MYLIRCIICLFLGLFAGPALAQNARPIVPGDVGIQVPFSAVNDLLVSGPSTSQLRDASSLTTSSSDGANAKLARTANFSGGIHGNVNAALRVEDTVSAGTTSFEWAFLSILFNNGTSADASQNVAAYAQGRKLSTGSTWALVSELQDSSTDPVASSVSSEINLFANNTDANGERVILDIVGGKLVAGVTPTITRAIRIGGQNLTTANATFARGLSFAAATYTSLIGTETTPTTTNGIDLTGATISGNAFLSTGFTVDSTGIVTASKFSPTSNSAAGNGLFLTLANQPAISASGTQVARFANTNSGIVLIGNPNNNTNDNLTVGISANAERSVTFINGNGGAAAQETLYFGNATSGTEAYIKLNGSGFAGGLGANAFAINGGAGLWLEGGGNTAIIITSGGVPQLPNVAVGVPVASLCLDAANNIVKKTVAGSCI